MNIEMIRKLDTKQLSLRISCAAALLLVIGCDTRTESMEVPAVAPAAEVSITNKRNMRLIGTHDLQARSAYQPIIHTYGDRSILFVGQHAGEAMNPATGVVETNGMSILDVTDPSNPKMLRHVPPTGDEAKGTQHVQVCNGSDLPNGDPDRVYLVRTNGLLSYELFDVTIPEEPYFLSTIATTGYSSRRESSRGVRETHKGQWDCETGIGYFNGTAEAWRVTRVLQVYDLGNPKDPRHIRNFGLVGWQPDAEGPMPAHSISGLHQPYVVGNRMYLGYGSGNNGTLQILDLDKFLSGDPEAEDRYAPTPKNLLYPQIARLDMPSYWGVHTAKPVYGIQIPDYGDDMDNGVRDILLVPSEAGRGARRCQGTRDVMFILDITEENKPFPISSYQMAEEPGDFCHRGGRFGPHSINDANQPGFDGRLVVMSYFNGGIRAVDIRDPFNPIEVGHFVPETTENTTELCVEIDDIRICDAAIQTNNVNIDNRGYIYAVDRSSTGLHILELTGEAREIIGMP
jgi:hypothetical protein